MSPATELVRPLRITPAGLRWQSRALHRPSLQIWSVGWLSVCAALALSILGIAAIGTTTPDAGQPDFAVRHAAHLVVGWIGAATVAWVNYRRLQRWSYPLMILTVALLLFVLIPFVPQEIVRPRNGARRWINMIVTDFQPSELAKLTYVLALASYLRFRSSYRTISGLLPPLLLTFIPMGLVLVEPDLGTALLFLPTLFAVLIAAGARLKHITLIVVLGLALAPAMYPLMRPHQKDRIQAMIAQVRGDTRYQDDIGYQAARAMTLVGAGGILGVGKQHAAALVQYNRLPEEHNDMIFAVVCCRWGLLGALTVWAAFTLLCLGGLIGAASVKDPFARLIAVGIVAMLFSQMLINTGMVVGLLPITGITLPFISYGGSSLVSAWLMIGLLLSVGMRRPATLAGHPFEYDDPDEDD
jgi:rod shape determining protein RodA